MDLNSVLGVAHWPKLQTLEFYGVHISSAVAVSFFTKHPTIQSLLIIETTDPSRFIKTKKFDFLNPKPSRRIPFPKNILPNLRYLNVPSHITLSIINSPSKLGRKFSELIIRWDTNIFIKEDFRDLSSAEVTRLQLATWSSFDELSLLCLESKKSR